MKTEVFNPHKVTKDTVNKLQKKMKKLKKRMRKNDQRLGRRQQQVSTLEGKQAKLAAKHDSLAEKLENVEEDSGVPIPEGDELGAAIAHANRSTKKQARRAS